MTIKELKELLSKADDDMQVLIPVSGVFNGKFYSPCPKESGVADMGLFEDVEVTAQDFILIPCGFFESENDHIELKLDESETHNLKVLVSESCETGNEEWDNCIKGIEEKIDKALEGE